MKLYLHQAFTTCFILICALCFTGCELKKPVDIYDQTIDIAFASCIRQWDPQPAWKTITQLQPELFIFMGDNVYNDVGDYKKLSTDKRIRKAYQDQSNQSEFAQFIHSAEQHDTQIYATWDDHDYGLNDAGASFPGKLISKEYFSGFFEQKFAVKSLDQPGVYSSTIQDIKDIKVQIILLDTRSFRSDLNKLPTNEQCPRIHHGPNTDPDATLLGAQQWKWLEDQLEVEADLKLIVSSIQVIPDQHCFEKWANFPTERSRLFELLSKHKNILILSGDRHHAEISRFELEQHSIYEITSSGLNSAIGRWGKLQTEENPYRVGGNRFVGDNFGSIRISRINTSPIISLNIHNTEGKIIQGVDIPLTYR